MWVMNLSQVGLNILHDNGIDVKKPKDLEYIFTLGIIPTEFEFDGYAADDGNYLESIYGADFHDKRDLVERDVNEILRNVRIGRLKKEAELQNLRLLYPHLFSTDDMKE